MQTTPFSNVKNKSGKLKEWYNKEFIIIFCREINPDEKYFSNDKFIKDYTKALSKRELKERLIHIANLLNQLDYTYPQTLKILKPLLGDKLKTEEGMFRYGYHLYPVSQFIELFGVKHYSLSISFIKELTMRFTGEFAIRPFANAYEKQVLKQMKEWSRDDNLHVRRLASEGLRPRLPWGKSVTWVNQDPSKVLPIYNKLRNDSSLYVRRSVANAMGDIIKLDDDLAYSTFQKWLEQKQTKENTWVIGHAVRTPAKKEIKKYVKLRQRIKALNF